MTQTYKPPKCECGSELTLVWEWENVRSVYLFNQKTGAYESMDSDGEVGIECTKCLADVSELFPEGVCNYRSSEPK